MVKLKKDDKRRPRSLGQSVSIKDETNIAAASGTTTIDTAPNYTRVAGAKQFVEREPLRGHIFTATILPSTPEDVAVNHVHPWQPLDRNLHAPPSAKKTATEQWPQSTIRSPGARGDIRRKQVSFASSLATEREVRRSHNSASPFYRLSTRRSPRDPAINEVPAHRNLTHRQSNISSSPSDDAANSDRKSHSLVQTEPDTVTSLVRMPHNLAEYKTTLEHISSYEQLQTPIQPRALMLGELAGSLWYIPDSRADGSPIGTSQHTKLRPAGHSPPVTSICSHCGARKSCIIPPEAVAVSTTLSYPHSHHTIKPERIEQVEANPRCSSQILTEHNLDILGTHIQALEQNTKHVNQSVDFASKTNESSSVIVDNTGLNHCVTRRFPQQLGRFPSLRGRSSFNIRRDDTSQDLRLFIDSPNASNMTEVKAPACKTTTSAARSVATTLDSQSVIGDLESACLTMQDNDESLLSMSLSKDVSTTIDVQSMNTKRPHSPQGESQTTKQAQIQHPERLQAVEMNPQEPGIQSRAHNSTMPPKSRLVTRLSFFTRRHNPSSSENYIPRSSSVQDLRIPHLPPDRLIGANGRVNLPMTPIAARHLNGTRLVSATLADLQQPRKNIPIAIFEQRVERDRRTTIDFTLADKHGIMTQQRVQSRPRSEPTSQASTDHVLGDLNGS